MQIESLIVRVIHCGTVALVLEYLPISETFRALFSLALSSHSLAIAIRCSNELWMWITSYNSCCSLKMGILHSESLFFPIGRHWWRDSAKATVIGQIIQRHRRTILTSKVLVSDFAFEHKGLSRITKNYAKCDNEGVVSFPISEEQIVTMLDRFLQSERAILLQSSCKFQPETNSNSATRFQNCKCHCLQVACDTKALDVMETDPHHSISPPLIRTSPFTILVPNFEFTKLIWKSFPGPQK